MTTLGLLRGTPSLALFCGLLLVSVGGLRRMEGAYADENAFAAHFALRELHRGPFLDQLAVDDWEEGPGAE